MERVRPVSITHKDHYVNIAKRRAKEANEVPMRQENCEQNGSDVMQINGYKLGGEKQSKKISGDCRGGFFADQFENLANFRAHYEGTGPEIWEQTGGDLHVFVAAAGTGGTLAGVSRFLKVRRHPILWNLSLLMYLYILHDFVTPKLVCVTLLVVYFSQNYLINFLFSIFTYFNSNRLI